MLCEAKQETCSAGVINAGQLQHWLTLGLEAFQSSQWAGLDQDM